MKSGVNQPGRAKSTVIHFAVSAILVFAPIAFAAEKLFDVSSVAPQQTPLSIPLGFRETPYSVIAVGLGHTEQSGRFFREPPGASSELRRGKLHFHAAQSSMAFLWDVERNHLVLDLNRNEDLTDDPGGTIGASAEPISSASAFRHAVFPGVTLILPSESGEVRYLVDFNFSEYRNRLNVYAQVRSFIDGKATLDGREWQLGVASDLGVAPSLPDHNYLIVRPWEQRDQPFEVRDGSLTAFPIPKELFIARQLYEIQLNRVTNEALLSLTQKAAELGEIQITGTFLRRVLISNSSRARSQVRTPALHARMLLLEAPTGSVHVPVGVYNRLQAQVGNGPFSASARELTRQVHVSNDRPGALEVGGPLTNSVSFAQRGGTLVLNYRLIGAGSDPYSIATIDSQHPPEFAIFHDDRKIASGKFEFG